MRNHKSFKDVIDVLKKIQLQTRDTAEHGISVEIEEVIQSLELIESESNDQSVLSQKALNLLGDLFNKFPSILRLIQLLSGDG